MFKKKKKKILDIGLIFRQKLSDNVYHFDVMSYNINSDIWADFTIGYIIVNITTGSVVGNLLINAENIDFGELRRMAYDWAKDIHKYTK